LVCFNTWQKGGNQCVAAARVIWCISTYGISERNQANRSEGWILFDISTGEVKQILFVIFREGTNDFSYATARGNTGKWKGESTMGDRRGNVIYIVSKRGANTLCGLGPWANYTDRATTACSRS
jgi:hypothetical protein